jgi:hypothetical protein
VSPGSVGSVGPDRSQAAKTNAAMAQRMASTFMRSTELTERTYLDAPRVASRFRTSEHSPSVDQDTWDPARGGPQLISGKPQLRALLKPSLRIGGTRDEVSLLTVCDSRLSEAGVRRRVPAGTSSARSPGCRILAGQVADAASAPRADHRADRGVGN